MQNGIKLGSGQAYLGSASNHGSQRSTIGHRRRSSSVFVVQRMAAPKRKEGGKSSHGTWGTDGPGRFWALFNRRTFLNLEMAADRGVRGSGVTQADHVPLIVVSIISCKCD
ncbi:uncharacterized protein TrAFT101_007193 [Trichoderma asperellum]|uniref:uncharacterized protein n=1 Tax=Trichoderma asperellum TaxID=101201 RepID=UPI0033189FEC|nr:hypothetical protein TrAFT101_007193 [Trichoderma asperellum]